MNQNFIITQIKKIILVGHDEYSEKTTTFSNILPNNELIFTLSGKAIIQFNGKTLLNEPNTVRFLPKGISSEYIVVREENGDCIDIFFDTNVAVSEEAFVLNLKNSDVIKNLFKKIFSLWVAKNEGYYFECISLLYKIFAELQKENYIPEKQYQTIKPAIDYINENFLNTKLPITHLADICGISVSYLKKLFVKKFRMTPVKYIIQLKINYACDLLRSDLYSITKIAEICGYNNVYYFSRQFKENMGISPSEFVEKYKSSK